MRDDSTRYTDAGIVVAGVNGSSARSHWRFAAKHGFGVRLLADGGLRVAERYEAVTKFGPLRFIRRTVVGIDIGGSIVYYKRGMPSTDEILAAMK